MTINQTAQAEVGATGWRYVVIGLAAAFSGTLLKWMQSAEETNVLVTALLYVAMTLLPAVLTYFLLARDQERKLHEVSRTLRSAMERMADLKRVVDIEKNYYANEKLIAVERRVLEATGSSMMEVAELVSAFDDKDIAHVKLKERFRVHAKSILTFRRAFQFEVESNFKEIGQVEHEFDEMPHDVRDQRIYESGRARTERLSQRYELGAIASNIQLLTDRASENAQLASETHQKLVERLDGTQGVINEQ